MSILWFIDCIECIFTFPKHQGVLYLTFFDDAMIITVVRCIYIKLHSMKGTLYICNLIARLGVYGSSRSPWSALMNCVMFRMNIFQSLGVKVWDSIRNHIGDELHRHLSKGLIETQFLHDSNMSVYVFYRNKNSFSRFFKYSESEMNVIDQKRTCRTRWIHKRSPVMGFFIVWAVDAIRCRSMWIYPYGHVIHQHYTKFW